MTGLLPFLRKLQLFFDNGKCFLRLCGFPAPGPLLTIGSEAVLRAFDPSGNGLIHDFSDFPKLPLLGIFKSVAQCLPIQHEGTDMASLEIVQEALDHSGLAVLRHEVPLDRTGKLLHFRRQGQSEITALIDRHGLCPKLTNESSGFCLILQKCYNDFR